MILPVQPGPASHNQKPSGSSDDGRTYRVKGINLKAMPMGETDRLMTVLTPEQGLVRAIAPGARKHNSRFTGRSSLFVINNLMLARGKNLDRIIQAETLYSFPGLAKDLGKLTAAQYLAEMVLYQGLSDQPQDDLYYLLQAHLERIESADNEAVLACLSQAVFHLLSHAGLAPQSHQCCISREPIQPQLFDPRWSITFSVKSGGLVQMPETEIPGQGGSPRRLRLNALEVSVFQRLAESELPDIGAILEEGAIAHNIRYPSPWLSIERALRQYVQYHFDRTIRSAGLIDTYFAATSPGTSSL